jgi:hypothetical protein
VIKSPKMKPNRFFSSHITLIADAFFHNFSYFFHNFKKKASEVIDGPIDKNSSNRVTLLAAAFFGISLMSLKRLRIRRFQAWPCFALLCLLV